MKKSEMRSALERLNQRLDNQWAYAWSDAETDIAAGRAEYNDDGERLPAQHGRRSTALPQRSQK